MGDFLKMDIFFAVATLAVVVVTSGLTFIFVRFYRILGHIEKISADVEAESAEIRADVATLRETFKKEGIQIALLVRFFRRLLKRFFTNRRA